MTALYIKNRMQLAWNFSIFQVIANVVWVQVGLTNRVIQQHKDLDSRSPSTCDVGADGDAC